MNGYDELGFNCYEPPTAARASGLPSCVTALSAGVAVGGRQAGDQRGRLLGHGRAGDTVITADYFANPDWHWTPPPRPGLQLRPREGQAALDGGGLHRLKDGVRVDKKAQPIELRFWARQSSCASQASGKMLAGWFRDMGLKIELPTMDEGCRSRSSCTTRWR